MQISEPGIFYDMTASDYHADPCPAPSITQSLAKLIIAKSPWHAMAAHPRLAPEFKRDDPTKFDIGNVAHAMLLGRGKSIVTVDADDWRTKAAKEAREAAAAEGKLAVLARQYDQAGDMVRAARLQLAGRFDLGNLFDDGASEVVLAWQEDGIWLRTMIDFLSNNRLRVVDYKTTIASAAPIAIPTKMAQDGWCIQSAMFERGLDALHPATAGRREYLYVCQESEQPYALSVNKISEAPLTVGRKQLVYAITRWRNCLLNNRWDGYEGINEPEYPGYAEARWLDREIKEAARDRVPHDLLMAG